jgi:hypothetical protein
MISQDAQAALQGYTQGRNAFAGLLPSGQNVGGAASSNIDPAGPLFQHARAGVLRLINYLHQQRDEQDANRLMKLMTQLQDIAMERRKRMADRFSQTMTSQSAVGGLNAMGVPNQ